MERSEEIKSVFAFLSKVNKVAYNDIYLLSNQVLSKNPFNNSFFENYLEYKSVKSISLYTLTGRLIAYYVKSVIEFCKYLFCSISYTLSRQEFDLKKVNGEIILIEVFFLIDKIEKERTFSDPYFLGLEKILRKLGKVFAYVPMFSPAPSPLRLYRILRLIKKEKVPVLSGFQLLSWNDSFALLYFLVTYPFHVLKIARNLRNDSYANRLLKFELLRTINQVPILSFDRYLQGKAIASIPCSRIKFISWYENHTTHKNMYKGLRTGREKVFIYGAQLFYYAATHINIMVDHGEVCFGIVPDKIIVNGPNYLPDGNKKGWIVGPSLRYKRLFEATISFETRVNLLALLPYIEYEIVNILTVLGSLDYPQERIRIKFHPATQQEDYEALVPIGAKVVKSDIYDLFRTTKIVIGAQTGSLVEAACLAIPAVIVENPNRFNHNPFEEKGKGVIWDSGKSGDEIKRIISKFEVLLANQKDRILEMADYYKSGFFSEPSDQKIIEAFGLK